jgi:ribosomal protein S26
MRKQQIVDTSVGPTVLDVFECDRCGAVEPEGSAINWVEVSWVGAQALFQLSDAVSYAMTQDALFCSTVCAVEGLETVQGMGTRKRGADPDAS